MPARESNTVWQQSFDLEVKTRGPSSTEFAQPEHRLPSDALPAFVVAGHPIRVTVEVTSRHTYDEWARAYARQGASDLTVYSELRDMRKRGVVPECHELHYLQMALEKVARAYLLKHSQGDRSRYLSTHVAAGEFMKLYAQSAQGKARFQSEGQIDKAVKQLAREIEHLTPAVEREARPSNVEYPWSDGVALTVPADVAFLSRWTFDAAVWSHILAILDEVSQALSR